MPIDEVRESSSSEKLIEHVFVSELLQVLWFRREVVAEVLRAEVDAWGYDIVVEASGVVRHVQLKTSRARGKAATVTVNEKLGAKPGGCVVWLTWEYDEGTRRVLLAPRWFGGAPGQPCPDLRRFAPARHSRANAQGIRQLRASTRKLPRGAFEPLRDMDELADRLFGFGVSPASAPAP